MSLVESYHSARQARLVRLGVHARPKPVVVRWVEPPIDPEPYYSSMWFYNLIEFAGKPLTVKVDDIQRAVCKHYGISRRDMLSHRRTLNLIVPRHVAVYLAKKMTALSLPQIGRLFGGRDHTTMLHSVRKMEAKDADDDMMLQARIIRARLLA